MYYGNPCSYLLPATLIAKKQNVKKLVKIERNKQKCNFNVQKNYSMVISVDSYASFP